MPRVAAKIKEQRFEICQYFSYQCAWQGASARGCKCARHGAANMQGMELQKGVHIDERPWDPMPAEAATAGGEWETVKKKKKSNRHHKKTTAASVGAAAATGVGAEIASASGVAVVVDSCVAAGAAIVGAVAAKHVLTVVLDSGNRVVAVEGLANEFVSVEPPLRADGRPQNYPNKVRNNSEGKNIVGLNSPLKQHEVVNLMKKKKVDVCGLLENKMSSSNVESMQKLRWKHWKLLTNVAMSSSPKIVIFWNPSTVMVDLVDCSSQGIYVVLRCLVSHISFHVTFVYGLHMLLGGIYGFLSVGGALQALG
ncbi:hypothetical protein OIU76_002021 [Salix suchowensis]|nr:hypothetical protein OIU76_002021 [Salix suchowensis]